MAAGACAAGHRDGAQTVELMAQLLPFLPGEEFGQRHGFAEGNTHRRFVYIMDAGVARPSS